MHLLSRSEEIILLAVLKLKGKAYGISIRDHVTRATGFKWSLGAVYAPLHRLEKKGLVQTNKSEPIKERGGRSKVFYQVSAAGKEALLKIFNVNENMWKKVSAPELKEA
jgi:DNA-binding PadR family transcriptional regulator